MEWLGLALILAITLGFFALDLYLEGFADDEKR